MGLYEFLDNKRTLWFGVALLVIIIVITYLTAGIYRQVIIQGKVWEWVNAPEGAAGSVYTWERPSEETENWVPPPGVELQPVHGVYIRCQTFYKGRQYETILAISRQDGNFSKKSTDWDIEGGIDISMNASKEGYNSVNAAFVNKGDPNVVYIILTQAE